MTSSGSASPPPGPSLSLPPSIPANAKEQSEYATQTLLLQKELSNRFTIWFFVMVIFFLFFVVLKFA